MAHHETKRDDSRRSAAGGRGVRSGLFVGAAVVLLAIAGFVIYVIVSDDPVTGTLIDSPVEDTRPVGAGTFPDGEADEFNEGLRNETTRDDFIEETAPTEAFPNPLLDPSLGDRPTAPSIEDLSPGPAVDDEVLERMTPDPDASAPSDTTTDTTTEPEAEPEDL